MAVLKCKMCGGDLEIFEGSPIAKCEFCGTKQTVPNADNDKKLKLFDRATRLRLACEFDKAYSVYESIALEFEKEAEAHWGLVLCNYGIEYVDDPKTGDKIPTCHRSDFDSVFDDQNYKNTIANASTEARNIYENEAKAIEDIRKGIIEISSKEDPYDIFICYKETAKDGGRTLDSVKAEEIYNELTEKGYKVFFAKITLENQLGTKYEPYIFSALHSAKIMLVVATDPANIESVWVKNEWSRYLKLIEKGEKKTLIPCYLNMDAYDLPAEFSDLQGQDLSKLGAMQDLVRGIMKIAPLEKTRGFKARPQVAPTVANILKRAEDSLETGNFKGAMEHCENALNIDFSNGDAHFFKVLAENRIRKREDLATTLIATDTEIYKTFLKYAYTELLEEVNGCLDLFYNNAIGLVNEEEYDKARNIFTRLNGYKESGKWLSYIRANEYFKSKDYEMALKMLEELGDFADAREGVKTCKECIEKEKIRIERAYQRYKFKYPILAQKEQIEAEYEKAREKSRKEGGGCLGAAGVGLFFGLCAGVPNLFLEDKITQMIAWIIIGLAVLGMVIAACIDVPRIVAQKKFEKVFQRYNELQKIPKFDPNQNYDI